MQEPNPYAASSLREDEYVQPVSGNFSSVGVFHDDGSLVIDQTKFVFPNICLKTGAPCTEYFQLKSRVLSKSNAGAAALLGGAVGLVLAKSLFGTNFEFNIPMNPNAKDLEAGQSKRGWKIVWIGFGLIVAGIVLSIFSEVLMFLCVVGMVVGIAGLFVGGYKSSNDPFHISKFNERFVWIEGANKLVLQNFDRFPGS